MKNSLPNTELTLYKRKNNNVNITSIQIQHNPSNSYKFKNALMSESLKYALFDNNRQVHFYITKFNLCPK